jgi:short-subunit dehydrogenase
MLSGKTVWLVGASEGIGRELAIQLAQTGARLIISARNAERLNSLISELTGDGHLAVSCDVTSLDSISSAWQMIGPRQIDMLIYNAGAYEPMSADNMDLPQIENIIDINLHGALRVLSHVVPSFVARRAGHIALVGSIAGYRGLPGAMGYSLSKAALITLAECLRCDLGKYGIGIQIINPGFVKTRLTDKNDFQMINIITPQLAARRIVRDLGRAKFEIRFPWVLTTLFKFFRQLPYGWYFKIMSKR